MPDETFPKFYKRILHQAETQGYQDASEGLSKQTVPQLLEALGVKVLLTPSQLVEIELLYQTCFDREAER